MLSYYKALGSALWKALVDTIALATLALLEPLSDVVIHQYVLVIMLTSSVAKNFFFFSDQSFRMYLQ